MRGQLKGEMISECEGHLLVTAADRRAGAAGQLQQRRPAALALLLLVQPQHVQRTLLCPHHHVAGGHQYPSAPGINLSMGKHNECTPGGGVASCVCVPANGADGHIAELAKWPCLVPAGSQIVGLQQPSGADLMQRYTQRC